MFLNRPGNEYMRVVKVSQSRLLLMNTYLLNCSVTDDSTTCIASSPPDPGATKSRKTPMLIIRREDSIPICPYFPYPFVYAPGVAQYII